MKLSPILQTNNWISVNIYSQVISSSCLGKTKRMTQNVQISKSIELSQIPECGIHYLLKLTLSIFNCLALEIPK